MTDATIARRLERAGAATGACYVVAIIVGEQLRLHNGGAGGFTDPAWRPDVFTAAGYALVVVGFTAFVVFVGYLHCVLRQVEGVAGWLSTVALGAGLLHAAVRFDAQAPLMAGGYRQGDLSPDLARTLVDLNDSSFVVTGLLLGLYVAAASGACLGRRVVPTWLAWTGLATGLLAVAAGTVGIVDPRSYNPIPFLAGTIWTLAISLILTARTPLNAAQPPAPDLPVASRPSSPSR